MNTILIAAVLAAGPMSAAINQAKPVPMPAEEWIAKVIGNTTIELPVPEVIETEEYQRTAPANYKMPLPTKTVPRWCPASPQRIHGYNCGMVQAVEDLAGHLQSVHKVDLELLNSMGRSKWQDYHDDLHWCEESESRQQQFLHPQAAAPAKPGCASGNCPSGNCPSYRTRGFF